MKKAIIAGLLLAIAGSALAQVDPNRLVAVVDGVEIRGAEYYRRMEFLPGVGKLVGNTLQQFYPGFMTLEQLINEKLIFELAKNKGVLPSDAQVNDELASRLKIQPTYQEQYVASGRTAQDLKYDIKFELAQLNLLTAGITVTDQEVEKFYAENHPMFSVPRTFHLRLIAVNSQSELDMVDKELLAGKSFAEVAKAHSVDPSAAAGGDIGARTEDEFSKEAQAEIAATPVGKSTKWFRPNDGTGGFRFQVVEVMPEKLRPLDDEVRREARLRMRMDRGRIRNDIKKDLDELRKKAVIDIKDKNLADAYKKWVDAYFKASGG